MKKDTTNTRGPGRPKYTPDYPRKKLWTFTDLEDANGVNPNTGKGKFCTTLTLRKELARDMFLPFTSGKRKGKPNRNAPNSNSIVVLMEDLQASSNSDKGLGRKQNVYILRAKLDAKTAKAAAAPAAPKATRKTRKATAPVTVDVSKSTTDYEATKAALLAPEAVTVPAVTVTPTPAPAAPAPETSTAPVAEAPAPAPAEAAAPAPEAQAAEVAAVAAEATAPTPAS